MGLLPAYTHFTLSSPRRSTPYKNIFFIAQLLSDRSYDFATSLPVGIVVIERTRGTRKKMRGENGGCNMAKVRAGMWYAVGAARDMLRSSDQLRDNSFSIPGTVR